MRVSTAVRPRVDVIVVCWNDRNKIATALDSVFALSELRAEPSLANVIVSDNGSPTAAATTFASGMASA